MKKLLINGAAFVLMAEMGITAAAAGPNLFAARTMKPDMLWGHCTNHWQRHADGGDCVAEGNFGGFCSLDGTNGMHHAEIRGDCWTDERAVGEESCYTGNSCSTAADTDGWTGHHGSGHHGRGHHR